MKFHQHLWATLVLAIPVTIGQLGSLLMNVADNMMVGHLGQTTLSAASLANGCYILVAILGMGTINAIPSLVAEARGAQRETDLVALLKGSVWFGLIAGLVIFILIVGLTFLLPSLGQPAEDIALATPFLLIMAISAIPMHLFLSIKGYFDGMEQTKIGMYLSIGGVLLNIGLNFILIYGYLGFPALGLIGSAYATLISRSLQAICIWALLSYQKETKERYKAIQITQIQWPVLTKILRLGFPMGLQIFFELAAFSGATIMMGWLPDASVARSSHQIAINTVSVTFMFAFGLGIAGSVRVGEAYGRKNLHDIRAAAAAALLLSLIIMGLTSILVYIFRYKVAQLYGFHEGAVWQTTAELLIIGAVFQLFDGAQCVGAAVLRGVQDVKVPTWITFFSYWVLWIPVAYYFAFNLSMGAHGVWWADVLALGVAALFLNARFFFNTKKFLIA